MSYVSLLKNIPEILGQPTGIAALASVGIHGAIALIVPLMPVDSQKTKESDSTKAVGVMELSQADQNRLPQTPGSTAVLPQPQLPLGSQFRIPSQVPPMNLGSQATTLPPLPPPPASSQLVLPPIPKSLDQYRVSSLPKGQSLQIVPRGNFRFDTSGFNANKKFSASVPRFNEKDIKLGEAKPLPIDKLPTLPGARIPDGLPNYSAANPYATDTNATPQTTQPENGGSQVIPDEHLIARIDKTPQTDDKLSLAGESLPQWQKGSTSNIPDEFAFKNTEPEIPSATSPTKTQVSSYEDLRKTVQAAYPNAEEKSVIRDTINTDKPELEGTVLGGLVIDPDGKVLEIKFQDKLASNDLLLKAREYFAANPPKGHQQTSYYPFRLKFQNNSSQNTGSTQDPTLTPAAASKPLSRLLRNQKQPETTPAATSKPLSNPVDNQKQPETTPAAASKPLSNPVDNKKQPETTPAATSKPLSDLLRHKKQPETTPAAASKPLSNPVDNPVDNKKQPEATPAATSKPLSDLLRHKKQPETTPASASKPLSAPVENQKQPASTSTTTDKPKAAVEENKNEPVTVVESGKKLIQQLRQLREQKQGSEEQK